MYNGHLRKTIDGLADRMMTMLEKKSSVKWLVPNSN